MLMPSALTRDSRCKQTCSVPERFWSGECAGDLGSIRLDIPVVPKTPSIGFAMASESEHDCWMFAIAFLFVRVLCDCFKSRRRLEAEILVLRHQLSVLQQRMPGRVHLRWADRAVFIWLYLC